MNVFELRNKLANGLRERLKSYLDSAVLSVMTNDQIIDSYLRCSDCGERELPDEVVNIVLESMQDCLREGDSLEEVSDEEFADTFLGFIEDVHFDGTRIILVKRKQRAKRHKKGK
jgi:hypothetical protein